MATDDELDELLARLGRSYFSEVGKQTRGSHRVKRSNKHGSSLVGFLNALSGTPAATSIAGYLTRAKQRLRLVDLHRRRKLSSDEYLMVVFSVIERSAIDDLLQLDEMEALHAINRVKQCDQCNTWIWARVKNQRYCSKTCRMRHFQTSPKGKKYKREWARKNYKRTKERDTNLLLAVRASVGRSKR